MPATHQDALTLESEALSQLALRCAARSLSKQTSRVGSRVASMNPSRVVSRAVSRIPSLEDLSVSTPEWDDFSSHIKGDAFTRILDVTNEQDAIMAYYYMDENNEVS